MSDFVTQPYLKSLLYSRIHLFNKKYQKKLIFWNISIMQF